MSGLVQFGPKMIFSPKFCYEQAILETSFSQGMRLYPSILLVLCVAIIFVRLVHSLGQQPAEISKRWLCTVLAYPLQVLGLGAVSDEMPLLQQLIAFH